MANRDKTTKQPENKPSPRWESALMAVIGILTAVASIFLAVAFATPLAIFLGSMFVVVGIFLTFSSGADFYNSMRSTNTGEFNEMKQPLFSDSMDQLSYGTMRDTIDYCNKTDFCNYLREAHGALLKISNSDKGNLKKHSELAVITLADIDKVITKIEKKKDYYEIHLKPYKPKFATKYLSYGMSVSDCAQDIRSVLMQVGKLEVIKTDVDENSLFKMEDNSDLKRIKLKSKTKGITITLSKKDYETIFKEMKELADQPSVKPATSFITKPPKKV